ncbi:hypothetical protein HDU81_008108 [Chytriomyces hyalinus]|nr:hypothetical protein HDU81_008108 [Chytriomyces hyalinus]
MAFLSVTTKDSKFLAGRDSLSPILYIPAPKSGYYTSQFTATLTNSDQNSVKACTSNNSTLTKCPPNIPFKSSMCVQTQCTVKIPQTFPQGNYQLGAQYQVCSSSFLCAATQSIKSNQLVFVVSAAAASVAPGSPSSNRSTGAATNRNVDSMTVNSNTTNSNPATQNGSKNSIAGLAPAVIAAIAGAVLFIVGIIALAMYLRARRRRMQAKTALEAERQGYFDSYGVYRLYKSSSK